MTTVTQGAETDAFSPIKFDPNGNDDFVGPSRDPEERERRTRN